MFKEKILNNNAYYYIIIKTILHMYNIQNISYGWSNSNTTYLGKVGSNSN